MSLLQLEESNTKSYLAGRGIDALRVTALGGGVSNMVLLAETTTGRIVLKQALHRLKVKEEWLSDPRRTVRECSAIRLIAPHLPEGQTSADPGAGSGLSPRGCHHCHRIPDRRGSRR